jgi:hypothetical protein
MTPAMDFTPDPDTSEYAALLDFVATGGRCVSPKLPEAPAALTRHALARRAEATISASLTLARLAQSSARD